MACTMNMSVHAVKSESKILAQKVLGQKALPQYFQEYLGK